MAQQSPLGQGFRITLKHITLGRNPLDEWSVRLRDLYLTTYNTHNKQTHIPAAEFDPIIPANDRPQTHALDRMAKALQNITSVQY